MSCHAPNSSGPLGAATDVKQWSFMVRYAELEQTEVLNLLDEHVTLHNWCSCILSTKDWWGNLDRNTLLGNKPCDGNRFSMVRSILKRFCGSFTWDVSLQELSVCVKAHVSLYDNQSDETCCFSTRESWWISTATWWLEVTLQHLPRKISPSLTKLLIRF